MRTDGCWAAAAEASLPLLDRATAGAQTRRQVALAETGLPSVAEQQVAKGFKNANAYVEDLDPDQLASMKARASGQLTAQQEAEIEQLVSPYMTSLLYETGVRNFNGIDPMAYSVGNWILAQPAINRSRRRR